MSYIRERNLKNNCRTIIPMKSKIWFYLKMLRQFLGCLKPKEFSTFMRKFCLPLFLFESCPIIFSVNDAKYFSTFHFISMINIFLWTWLRTKLRHHSNEVRRHHEHPKITAYLKLKRKRKLIQIEINKKQNMNS
jgi:hypothetical protein